MEASLKAVVVCVSLFFISPIQAEESVNSASGGDPTLRHNQCFLSVQNLYKRVGKDGALEVVPYAEALEPDSGCPKKRDYLDIERAYAEFDENESGLDYPVPQDTDGYETDIFKSGPQVADEDFIRGPMATADRDFMKGPVEAARSRFFKSDAQLADEDFFKPDWQVEDEKFFE